MCSQTLFPQNQPDIEQQGIEYAVLCPSAVATELMFNLTDEKINLLDKAENVCLDMLPYVLFYLVSVSLAIGRESSIFEIRNLSSLFRIFYGKPAKKVHSFISHYHIQVKNLF